MVNGTHQVFVTTTIVSRSTIRITKLAFDPASYFTFVIYFQAGKLLMR